MPGHLRRIAAALALGGSVAASALSFGAAADPKGALSCVSPLDASGIDRVLAAAGSPLAGQGATFVSAAASVGLDPRLLVAIAGHESVLMTYGPAAAIHNPFGIGPNRVFASDREAIEAAAKLIATNYVAEGRTTVAAISGKYAPVGVANDPTNLNGNWTGGVGTLYRRLGANPDVPVTLNAQFGSGCSPSPAASSPTTPATAGTGAVPAATTAPGTPAAGIVRWDGVTAPVLSGPGMEGGADPATGQPATIAGFVLPVVPGGMLLQVTDDFAAPGLPGCYGKQARCSVTIDAPGPTQVVAAIDGVLVSATAEESSQGIAFWVVAPDGERVGYSGLVAYAPGIAHTAAVGAGQLLGTGTPVMRIAWQRDGRPINAAPLLRAALPR